MDGQTLRDIRAIALKHQVMFHGRYGSGSGISGQEELKKKMEERNKARKDKIEYKKKEKGFASKLFTAIYLLHILSISQNLLEFLTRQLRSSSSSWSHFLAPQLLSPSLILDFTTSDVPTTNPSRIYTAMIHPGPSAHQPSYSTL